MRRSRPLCLRLPPTASRLPVVLRERALEAAVAEQVGDHGLDAVAADGVHEHEVGRPEVAAAEVVAALTVARDEGRDVAVGDERPRRTDPTRPPPIPRPRSRWSRVGTRRRPSDARRRRPLRVPRWSCRDPCVSLFGVRVRRSVRVARVRPDVIRARAQFTSASTPRAAEMSATMERYCLGRFLPTAAVRGRAIA